MSFRLFHSATSPYVRKVMMLVLETGLESRVQLVSTNAWAADTPLPQFNPLGKVPALQVDNGMVLFDSPVICEFLDSQHQGPRLFPAEGPERWRAQRLHALGDGLCDAAVARRMEESRPDGERSPAFAERQRQAMIRSLDFLEANREELDGPVTIGTLAVLAALGYLEFRFAADGWRHEHPQVAAWFAEQSQRHSYRHTAPPQ